MIEVCFGVAGNCYRETMTKKYNVSAITAVKIIHFLFIYFFL